MEFLIAITTLPTLLFTVLLVIASVYWLFVIIGAIDIEFLDTASGLDGVLDSAGEAAGEAAGEGVAEAAAGGGGGVFLGFLSALQVGRVPLTFTLSVWILLSWGFSFGLMKGVAGLGLPSGTWAYVVLAGVLAVLLGMLSAALLVRPLGQFFVTTHARTRGDFLGHECVIRTGSVDSRFGQAECDDGGSGLLIEVRCDRTNALQRGERALIVSYDGRREAYVIEPLAVD